MSEEKVMENILSSRSRARMNSTATVVTGDIVKESNEEKVVEEAETEKNLSKSVD